MPERILIRQISVYHPEKVVNNEYYLEHFRQRGEDISRLLNALGRENRYVANYEKETTLTMAIEASNSVLKTAKLTGEDLDMIVFVSGTPEYFWPPNAVSVHKAIHGKSNAMVYDMNVACVGMVVAVEQVSRSMLSNPHVNLALVVGSEQMHRYARKEEAVTYSSFGDGASAVILEKSVDRDAGFVDSTYHVNTESIDKIVLPACGFSHMFDDDVPDFDKRIQWENVNNDNGFLSTVGMIEKLLERNHLSSNDIGAYCFSQLSRKNIYRVQEALNEDSSKLPIVGTEYGYTGAASPFMALERAVSEGTINRDDYVILWSVGAGTSACAVLVKY